MDFLNLKKFIRAARPLPTDNSADQLSEQQPEEAKGKAVDQVDNCIPAEPDDEEDDDFITNEVQRRLKELRRNSFMALIPEEASHDDEIDDNEEEGESSSSEWRDVEAEGRQFWSAFDALYDTYSQRMLSFDRLNAQHLREIGSHAGPLPLERPASKKLSVPFRCLSLKKIKEPADEMEQLKQPGSDPCQDLEIAYVAQMCLTWEALHCQYTQLSQRMTYGLENSTVYNHSAQEFQQFQVLLQRFIENEPFEQGLRPEIYARTRNSLPKLLQVPKVQGSDSKSMDVEDSDLLILAPDLMTTIENSILTFYAFVKLDKKKLGGVRNIFGTQNQMATPLQQIQSSVEKKALKLKELRKRAKRWKKNAWPSAQEDVDLLMGSIDVKVISRVVRMGRISKEQLLWSEEKLKKIDEKLQRDPSPLLFPC